jgi:S1-C subfamily serine protease
MKKFLLLTFVLIFNPLFADQKKIEQMLEPVVEIRLPSLVPAGGSGTVIYSKHRNTFIITNFHVVEDVITDAGKKEERRKPVRVKFRVFADNGQKIKIHDEPGHIVKTDRKKDLAVVWVQDFEAKSVAQFLPSKYSVGPFDKIWSVGYPGLRGIYFTSGEIVKVNAKEPGIEYGKNAKYLMTNATIYFGSSGGATFTKVDNEYFYIGSPNCIYYLHDFPLCFYNISLETIREFLVENNLQFIEKNIPLPELKIWPEVRVIPIEIKDFLELRRS